MTDSPKPNQNAADFHLTKHQTDACLDLKGLSCPLPVLKADLALKSLPILHTLHVITTDPNSWKDIELWCQKRGHQLLDRQKTATHFEFWILKKQ